MSLSGSGDEPKSGQAGCLHHKFTVLPQVKPVNALAWVLPLSMVKTLGKTKTLLLTFVFLSLLVRSFTGAPNAQINYMGLIFDQVSANEQAAAPLLTKKADQITVTDHKGASRAPAKSAEYKLYKKYVVPDKAFSITAELQAIQKRISESIKSTSYYIKDLTLRSLHSNSPPTPFSTLVFTVFMCLVIIRIGVFGNYGEIKNSCNRRFSLH